MAQQNRTEWASCKVCDGIVERHDEQHPEGTGCGCLDALDLMHEDHDEVRMFLAWDENGERYATSYNTGIPA